jgi:hypothetical protein
MEPTVYEGSHAVRKQNTEKTEKEELWQDTDWQTASAPARLTNTGGLKRNKKIKKKKNNNNNKNLSPDNSLT